MDTRHCNKCGEDKSSDCFYSYAYQPGTRCKQCVAVVQAAWYAKNRENRLVQKRRYGKTHRAARTQAQRVWRLHNPAKVAAQAHRNKLMFRYELTAPEYRELLATQGGRCAICSTAIECDGVSKATARVDHDHLTGAVRGLLCHGCNVGLGWFRDNPVALENAARYIARPQRIALVVA